MKALSIRQPWAWLIVRPDLAGDERERAYATHSIKPVENRTWSTTYRGALAIHAGVTMTRDDYEACALFLRSDPHLRHLCEVLPEPEALDRGGIIGRARLIACQTLHESPWFCGPIGWVLTEATPLQFAPCKGTLGVFDVPSDLLRPLAELQEVHCG